jgi:hypothetical protein
MAKKTFANGLGSLLGENKAAPPVADQPTLSRKTTSSQEGTKDGETRATFIVNERNLQKLKDLAYWERLSIKDVINAAISEHISRYEKERGEIKPQP